MGVESIFSEAVPEALAVVVPNPTAPQGVVLLAVAVLRAVVLQAVVLQVVVL